MLGGIGSKGAYPKRRPIGGAGFGSMHPATVPRAMAAPSSSVHTMVKIIGAIAWLAGLVLLFLFPPMGLLILLIAIVLSILSLTWTRQARHAEVVAAAKAQPSPAPPLKKSTADRLV